MADENMVTDVDFSLDDLAEFGAGSNMAAVLGEEEVVLAEDLEGFAKGFPDWDLLPPRD